MKQLETFSLEASTFFSILVFKKVFFCLLGLLLIGYSIPSSPWATLHSLCGEIYAKQQCCLLCGLILAHPISENCFCTNLSQIYAEDSFLMFTISSKKTNIYHHMLFLFLILSNTANIIGGVFILKCSKNSGYFPEDANLF